MFYKLTLAVCRSRFGEITTSCPVTGREPTGVLCKVTNDFC